jgi:hypothetical protein
MNGEKRNPNKNSYANANFSTKNSYANANFTTKNPS